MGRMEPPQRRAFVIRDFSVEKIGDILQSVERRPPEGWSVRVVGPSTDVSKGEIFFDAIRPDIEHSDKLVALCERANANVAFEIGYALGIGKATVLATSEDVDAEHLRQQAPFQGLGIRSIATVSDLVATVTDAEGMRVEEKPEAGDETLFLCPIREGQAYHIELDALELPWRRYEEDQWGIRQLPALLQGVRRVVWTIAPVTARDETLRDGQGNTACALLAGFAHAHGIELVVFRASTARNVADVASIARSFQDLDEYVRFLKGLDAPKTRDGRALTAEEVLARYRAHLVTAHRDLVPFFGDSTRRLDEVFVQVAIERRDLEAMQGEGIARLEGNLERSRLTLRELLELPWDPRTRVTGRWLAFGDPGAGKSTLCRELCHRLGGEPEGPLSVLVPLSAWSGDPESCDPFDWIEREARRVEGETELEGLAAALRARAERPGGVWLLLDGLDEVLAERRAVTIGAIAQLAQRLPNAVLLVTSRSAGIDAGELASFRETRLQPLAANDQRRLLEGWLGRDLASRALHQIEGRPRIAELARNPLLLTLLAKLVEEGPELWGLDPELPRNRGGLYERALDLLLRRGHSRQRKEGVKDRHAATLLLARLSLDLQRSGGESWPRRELVERMWRILKGNPDLLPYLAPWDSSPERFVDDVGQSSGVLAPHDGPGSHWRYLHRSLREHLAARAIVDGEEESLVARLKEDTAHWGEVTALVCGMLDRQDDRRAKLIEELVTSDHNLATRTLPQLEGLGVEEALDLLDRVPEGELGVRWDGDDLLLLLKGLLLEGHKEDELRVAVMARVSSELSTEQLAYRLYALEDSGVDIEREAFFRACGRWPESDLPAGPPMVRIPPGLDEAVTFLMGSPEDDPGRFDDEGPQHSVTLRPFLLASTPVTGSQYARFDPEHPMRASDLPVVEVSWWEAWLYCRWIDGHLPTEAQWECACRAGTTTPWSTGSALTRAQANISQRDDNIDHENEPAPVASYPPSPWELHDMHGNVWEWCADGFGPYGLPVREGDGLRLVEGAGYRVCRGGSFGSPARSARSAYRSGWRPGLRSGALGFRPAQGISPV